MDGQLEALSALDDWSSAVQRIRDIVAAAQTYAPGALRESVKPLWQDTREAQTRLVSALGMLERETKKEKKPPEIEGENKRAVGWQEILRNGKRAARVSIVGETITVCLREAESRQAQREIQLCSSCKTIVEECPRCGAEAEPAPVHACGDAWTEFHCSSCSYRFPDSGENGLCPKCLSSAGWK